MISQQSFSNPDELLEILSMACRAQDGAEAARKKQRKLHKVSAFASRLDQTAEWKPWSEVAGVKFSGIRTLFAKIQSAVFGKVRGCV